MVNGKDFRPRRVKIQGVRFSIRWAKRPISENENTMIVGTVDYQARVIRVTDGGSPTEVKVQRLFHEITHIIRDDLHIQDLRTEPNIDRLALGFAQVLLENRWLKMEDKK